MHMKEVSTGAKLKLELIAEREFESCIIQNSCTLREAVEKQLNAKFMRGHAYYEFAHKIENISEDKEIIFMDIKVAKL